MITEDQLNTLRDLIKFATKFLIIRTKSGLPKPFVFNRAQEFIHKRLEDQRKDTGKVRAIILKGRQAGCSTYIQARYFHKVITGRGKKAFILTHDKEATKNLFNMAVRFYENLEPGLVPKPDTQNAKELYFKEFDSGYAVGTAGNKSVGRSQTIQLFHGCLAEGSLIYNPNDNGIKKIEEFRKGDMVLTHNANIAPISYISMQKKECLSVRFRTMSSYPLVATPEHKFWTKNGWQELGKLKIGDSIGYPIRKIKGSILYSWIKIKEINEAGMKQVYDFEVDHPDHSYCAIQGATHNSEVGFWQFAEDHAKGILQAISSENGTEVILESTANGIGNYFHQRWIAAMSSDSDYQAIFVPWYWQNEYKDYKPGFEPNESEEYLMSLYQEDGLTLEHLAWRRIKIGDLSKDYDAGLEQFKQEYPFSATEAFLNPISNVFINSRHVNNARNARVDAVGPLIIGVDVAISDKDRTAIIRRKGRCAFGLEKFGNHNTMEICGVLKRIITNEKPAKVYIDCIGIGAGVVDRLQEMGYDCVEGVNVARSANEKEKFRNLRAELWSDMRDWLTSELSAQIPDDDELHGELCSLGFKFTSSGQLQIESKLDLRARGMPSPDGADALSLSFYGGCFGNVMSHIEIPQLSPWEKKMFR